MDENELLSAQAQTADQSAGGGIQARIDELTAKFRQAEESNRKLQEELLRKANSETEMARQLAEQAQRYSQAQAAPQAPVDPLASYRDRLDPVALEAIQSTMNAMQANFQGQLAATQKKYELEQSVYAVRAEIAGVRGLPPEVAQRAESLMQQWRQAGWNVPTATDAIDIALGQHQRGQLARAAPVMGYQQNHSIPTVTPGYAPSPAAPRSALPANFDSLSPQQQLQILEQNGVGDHPL